MRQAWPAALLAATGCATGTFQTAKTLPAREVQVGLGVARVFTDREAAAAAPGSTAPTRLDGFTLPEAGLRLGVGWQTDVGLASYLGPGLRVDAKHNLMPSARPYALAPRVGGGWTRYDDGGEKTGSMWAWLAGLIASYDLHPMVALYTGATLVSHYISQPSSATPLAPGERRVDRTAWGDGLLQASLGAELRMGSHVALQGEYGYWAPLQNDPGDGYRFVPAHLLGVRLVFGSAQATR